ncbi:MAG: glucosaminidase domain-containing protein [Alphaproteobacteria bacterium]
MAAVARLSRDFLLRASVAAAIVAGVAVAAWQEHATSDIALRGEISAAWLADYHRELGYSLDDVRRAGLPVPRVILAELPVDLAKVEPTPLRKRLFIEGLLPVVLDVNERIAGERARLQDMLVRQNAGEELSSRDRVWLADIAARYGSDDMAELLRRVDIVPPSLAIAQAALESGWGSSRFAQEGNALFGQRVYGAGSSRFGMQPKGLAESIDFRVRGFASLSESVAAYAENLNSFAAYEGLRATRAGLRAEGRAPDGLSLAGNLLRYSEMGGHYVGQVRDLIRANGLAALDKARLADGNSAASTVKPSLERQTERKDI